MNLSQGSRVITYGIIAVNALVFVLMVVSGVSIITPTTADIINWGGNYGPLTLSGDWWRLITCVFVHIGIIHIAFNMYALYMVGVYLEPLLGKTKYVAAYLCTGIFASLASLWWHKEPVASAGASGAIFGIYGVFLALLSTSLIPKQIRNSLLQSIGIFVVYNLVYGMKSGVDNSAHIGGLVSGLLIGYLYYPGLKMATKKAMAVVGIIIAVTIAATAFYLQNNKAPNEARAKIKSELEDYKYKDSDKYTEQLNKVIALEKRALAPFDDSLLNDQQLSEKLQNISIPQWEKADEIVLEMKALDLSDRQKEKLSELEQYIGLRKEEIKAIGELALKEDSVTLGHLRDVRNEISDLFEKMSKP
jgi:rhomboid protease GluP